MPFRSSRIAGLLAVAMTVAVLSLPMNPSFAQEKSTGGALTDTIKGFLGGDDPNTDKAALSASAPAVKTVPASRAEIQWSFSPLVKKTAPAVVNVYAARVSTRSPLAGDPFFEQFFNRQPGRRPRVEASLGSGVIVDPSGIVVTNYHVIKGANDIKVALADGREFASHILLMDEETDLAILKLDSKEVFPTIPLANSDNVEVGDLVLAIGNPFGVGQTVTSGIVSAQARTRVGISDLDFFIQTDAAINPGNSGGALIGMAGELIGINSAIFSRSGGSVGIGFAIPSNMVRAVVEAAKKGDKSFARPFIGATFQAVTPDVAESLGLSQPYGALVTALDKDGPSEKAGLKIGDLILSANGARVEDPDSLLYRTLTAGVGSTLTLNVLRGAAQREVPVVLEVPPKPVAVNAQLLEESPLAGAEVADLTPAIARQFRLPHTAHGVVITGLYQGSPATRLNLHQGDIVRRVNGVEIGSLGELTNVLAAGTSLLWRFEFERNGAIIRQYIR
ncbi:DegQ family serine endoprotease [Phyllobacterium leguminum]|uniref:Do/DeqQ family serine protease n=1 Tax=Phyllobacterium leguminum TaxID=314237 RepID=A0A318T882_9HYPH|nr:DegQ family serine endoprotease [Phyllobacterium leguminum]PYE86804.1 Do/DeqQ family serine protease [Phyllobacterium leguminum]